MNKIALIILIFLSSIFGIKTHPYDFQNWKIINNWKKTPDGYFLFSAQNSTILTECKNNPSAYIKFPSIIHSSSQVKIENYIIAITSSSDFKYTRGFYGTPVISCSQIQNANQPLVWQVISYTKYFARFHHFPELVKNYPKENFFNETLNIVGASMLLAICILYITLFRGKVSKQKLIVLFFSNFFTSFYFIFNSIGLTGFTVPMLIAHKFADSGLWLGLLLFNNFLYLENLISYKLNLIHIFITIFGIIIILTATTGDAIQLGTTIPFISETISILTSIITIIKRHIFKSKHGMLKLLGLICFLIAYINDTFLVLGIIDTVPIASIGWISGYAFILISINESITNTYEERDQLKILTNQLQQTNENLKKTQDELIKSEKMAAMGRVVARIAHELNTPIYTVRSAAQNIKTQTDKFLNSINLNNSQDSKNQNQEKFLSDLTQYETDLNKMTKNLTLSIDRAADLVRNFKEISADQINVEKKDFKLREYIEKNLVVIGDFLKRKKITVNLKGDEVVLHSDPGLFYQIIQNLSENVAKYAYENDGGVIDIEIKNLGDKLQILFADYGKGISKENLPKIFDAFFTTAGGSGGVGLGLNIVYRIVTLQLSGQIFCESNLGKGTVFTIIVPC